MKLKLPLIAAFVAVLGLTACGGGSDSGGGGGNGVAASSPATLTKTDTTVGTGAEAVNGAVASLEYSLWLYNEAAADKKGAAIQANKFSFKLGAGEVIPGFEQGVLGMKVGGKRTILIPASLAYGATGSNGIPPNSGLVYEVTLTKIEAVSSPTALVKTDLVVGTGAEAVAGKTAALSFSLWLYDASAADKKGKHIQNNNFTFKLGNKEALEGFEQGVTGMRVGGKRVIHIPASLGYGSTGVPGVVPGGSGLVYEVTLNTVQ
jgi:FKBP-type peptidyl-prolyl cis-trans isomerase